MRYKDNDGFTYYYGLSRYGSALTVDPIDCTTGDVYTFALYNGHIVIPLSKKSTAAVTTTTPTTTSVTSTVIDTTKGNGDANCDGNVDMSDAVLIMQSIANPSKYKLTEEGKANADMNGDGITSGDALAIQKKLLKLD
ncbi:MAG: dockerin type I repeat-containing protein [Ruminococcus sp.]|nr:dockerin type I repeat-containing protein [Ruminococcus sp.]